MTTTTANVAPNLVGRIGECFKSALKKRKAVIEEAVPSEKVVATSSNLTKDAFGGSLEQTRDLVKGALVGDGRYGKYPYIIATYSDHVFVEADPNGPGETTRFFTVPYTVKEGAVTLAEPNEVEKITKFVIKEIAESVLKDLLNEGGAGSGNWGHKGRPGHLGGSIPRAAASAKVLASGGKKKAADVSVHAASKKSASSANFGGAKGTVSITQVKKGQDLKYKGQDATITQIGMQGVKIRLWKSGQEKWVKDSDVSGGGGVQAHVVGTKGGEKVHARTFYDKSGWLNRKAYSKLTPNQKQAVLSHGISKYKEQYVPKASQGSMTDAAKATNAKVGAIEGMRRAAIANASKSAKRSDQWRAAMHVAIQMQQKVIQMKGSTSAAGSKVASAVFGAIRTSAASPAKGGR